MSFLHLFAVGVELEIGFELGYGFVLLLHLLRNLGEGEVGVGVVGLDFDGVFGAEIGTLEVAVTHIKFGYAEVLVYAFVVGLDFCDFGKLAMD